MTVQRLPYLKRSVGVLFALMAGQGTAAVAGLPVAAKFTQAARMLAASVCWSGLGARW